MNTFPDAPLPQTRPLKVGLTGGIASGKSTIEAELKRLGVPTIDADAVVHDLLKNDDGLKAQIQDAFGDDVFRPDGEVDRRRLGAVVFAEPAKRRVLEGMIHPKVRERVAGFFRQCAADGQVLGVAVIPLIFESNLQDYYDVVWLVKATEAQQVARLVQNRGLTREEAMARIASQTSWEEKLRRARSLAHYRIIDNTGAPQATTQQVSRLLDEIG